MNSKHITVSIATVLAIAIAAPVNAGEPGPGDIAWMLIRDGLKQRFSPQSATPGHGMDAVPDIVPRKTADGCEVLQWDRKAFGKPYMSIRSPGRYCLDQDYEFECSILTHGCGGKMIEIRASNVDLDFRGHTLRMAGTRGYIGVWGFGRDIRVRNGHIKGAGAGIMLMNWNSSPQRAYPDMPVKSDDVFTETNFVVEHMQFSDVVTAVMTAGVGNQIRDNRIDATLEARATSGPPFALLSYGPSARIERNTFRLRDLTPESTGYAMYLRAADGTVVDGNTVRVEGEGTGTIGVGLSSSTGVALGRNRIDTEKMTELDARSSVTRSANPP